MNNLMKSKKLIKLKNSKYLEKLFRNKLTKM